MPYTTTEKEALTNWAVRERNSLLAGESAKALPIVCEFDGMGGTGKSRIISELGSHHFHSYGLDPIIFVEPNQSVHNVSSAEPIKFIEAQFQLTCDNLKKAHSPENIHPFAFFDRGIFDFILFYNFLFDSGHLNEDECRERMCRIFENGRNRVDLIFIFTSSLQASMQGKTVINSVSFINSLGLKAKSEKETYARFQVCYEIYRRFFINDPAVRVAVRQVVDINVGEAAKDFERIFEQVIATIDLYLVFKAWEGLFLARFGGKPLHLQSDIENRVIAFAGKLVNPFVQLREKLTKSGEIDPESNIGKILLSYKKTEFIIARQGNLIVTMKGIFDSPPKFSIYGL